MATAMRALATAALLGAAAAQAPSTVWDLVLMDDGVKYGARCLDGTPGAYYIKWGVGENASKWIVFWEGGGWCTSPESCAERAKGPLGSSSSYPANTTGYSARDLLYPNCTTNPAFCGWTTVYSPYCDGQSRSGLSAEPLVVGSQTLYFGGWRVLESVIEYLLRDPQPGAPPHPAGTLANATHLLISGSSAGGLTTYLHADAIASLVRTMNPGVVVKAVPEVGFFIDGASVWGGQHLMTQAYERAVAMSNATGSAVQLNAGCLEDYKKKDPANAWRCFLAQVNYPYMTTPTFIVNSAYDNWQLGHILAPEPDISVDVNGPDPSYASCLDTDPKTDCNATQFAQFMGYRDQFYAAFNASKAAVPPAVAAQHGGVITSCDLHTTLVGGLSHRIAVGGKTLYQRIVDWVFQAPGPGPDAYWAYDGLWPGNPTCHGPLQDSLRKVEM